MTHDGPTSDAVASTDAPAPPAASPVGSPRASNRAAVRVEPGSRAIDVSGRRWGRNQFWRRATPWLIGLVMACAWDRAVYVHVAVHDAAALAKLESSDWYRTLRIIGAPYIWLFVAVVFILFDAQRASRLERAVEGVGVDGSGSAAHDGDDGYFTGKNPSLRRATFLLLSTLVSGGAAEILKAVVGRFKPDTADGWYRFASLRERFVEFHWNDLGFVSSHAATAFGACFALSIMLPRASVVFMLMAIGCAMTRLLAGAHFLSDTYGAVLLAFVVTQGVYRLDRRNNAGHAIDATNL